MRAADYGQRASLAEYVTQANAETLVVIQIETLAAVEQAPAIAAVDGVDDDLLLGPTDLSQAFGVTGQLSHPLLEQAYDAIARAAREAGKALGVLVGNEKGLLEWRERGARYLAVTSDSLVTHSARTLLAAVR